MGCGASQALQWKADGRFLDARHTYVAPGADNGGKCDDEVSSRFGYVASARIPAPAVPAAILGPEPQPPSYVRGAGRRLEAEEADAPAVPPVENQAPSRDAGCLELGGQPQAARQGGISATPDDLQEETQVETAGSDGLIQEECSACGGTGRTLGKAGEEFVTAGGSSPLPELAILEGDARRYQASGLLPALPGMVWMIAFRQTMPYLWKQGQSLDLNVGDPDNGNFSLLECLEDLRGPDGMFRFMYRDRQHEGQYVVWQQSSNPGASSRPASDFEVLCWGPKMKRKDLNFRGLSRPAADAKCFMHGNLQDSDHWWYAVATYGKRNGGIPGMNQAEKEVSSQVELLVALPPRNANAILSGVSRSLPVLPRVESPRYANLKSERDKLAEEVEKLTKTVNTLTSQVVDARSAKKHQVEKAQAMVRSAEDERDALASRLGCMEERCLELEAQLAAGSKLVMLDGEARKYQAGGPLPFSPGLVWVVAFRQTAPFCWEAGGDLALDPGDPGSPNFSILEWLEECRSPDGDFHLMYRDERDDQFVMWQQATNPSTSQGAVGGFQVHGWGPGLKCDDSFGGLALLKGPHSLIGGVQNVPGGNGEVDGDGGKSGESFWYQLGARSFHQGAVPGMKTARTPYAHRVELLVGVEPTAVSKLVLKIAETARLSQGPTLEGSARQYQVKLKPVLPGLVWIVVFRQTMPFLWERDQDLAVNALDPSHQNFSILQCLDGCRGPDGAYNLMYRDLEHQGQWVAWSQSSNPAAEETATDVRVLHWGPSLSAADGKFGGLVRSSKRPCLMHSSSGSGSWWYYAVGTYAKWQGAIPGIQQAPSVATSSVELLVGLSPDGARDLIAQVAGGFERPSPGLSDPGALGQLQAAVEADLKARGVELKNVKIDLPNRQLSLLREVQFDRNSSVFTSPRDAHALLSEVATIVDVCNDQLSKRSGGLIGLLLEGHTTAGSRLRKLADARAQACADYLMDKLAGLKPPEGVDPATLIQSTGITKSDRMAVVVHVTAPGFNSTGSRAGGRRKR